MSNKLLRIIMALGIGCGMIHFGARLLDVRVELFWGLKTFSFAWIVNIFVVPFVTGWVLAWVYGMGAKMLAHFPPLMVYGLDYFQTVYLTGVPQGAALNPLGWWGLYVILTMEFCALGAFLGEFHLQKAVSRHHQRVKEEAERAASARQPDARNDNANHGSD